MLGLGGTSAAPSFGPARTGSYKDPGRDFLWDDLAGHGIDYENFGFFVDNPVDLQASIPGLLDHTDPLYPGWDLHTTDQTRIDRWQAVFSGYVKQGRMPTMQFVYLPSDHTYGTKPSARKPSVYVADNDLALGRLVQTVSHSPFWSSTAIFALEDDCRTDPIRWTRIARSRDQPVHADGRRRLDVLFIRVRSPDDRGILGVPAMSQFDAAANTMPNAFTTTPNLAPYDAVTPSVSLTATNTASSRSHSIPRRSTSHGRTRSRCA